MSLRYGLQALIAAGFAFTTPAPAQVMADIQVGGYPVRGRVVVGSPHVVARPVSRVIVVERVGRHHPDWYWRRGWRPVVVWWDHGRFVHPSSTWRPWYREVVVLERGGRFLLHDWAWDRFDDSRWYRGGYRYDPYRDRLHERRFEGRRWTGGGWEYRPEWDRDRSWTGDRDRDGDDDRWDRDRDRDGDGDRDGNGNRGRQQGGRGRHWSD
jgi:hypothetical protein